jgi:hypothetical protein
MTTMETNWVQHSSFVGFPEVLVSAMLIENPVAGTACALEEGARDQVYFLKLCGKEI